MRPNRLTTQYLQAIGANDKERERWLLKCARKIKTGATTSYMSRTSAT